LEFATFGTLCRLRISRFWNYRANMKKQQHPLSREAINEFKAVCLDEFGEILSDTEVQEIATRLLRFLGTLSK